MTVLRCDAYILENEEPLDDEEMKKLELACGVIMNYMAYHGLQNIVENLTFYDDSGYRNLRAFLRYTSQLNK